MQSVPGLSRLRNLPRPLLASSALSLVLMAALNPEARSLGGDPPDSPGTPATSAPVERQSAATLPSTPPSLAAPDNTPAPADTPASTTRIDLESGGLDRNYYLHVPPSQVPPKSLVVALPGRYQTPDKMREHTGLEKLADAEGIVVAFAGAVWGSWNAGACCAEGAGLEIDDVAYVKDVIADASRRTGIDWGGEGRPVFVVGFSNGGMLAYKLVCEGVEVAGIGVVGGAMLTSPSTDHQVHCDAGTVVIHVQGERDTTVNAVGGYQPAIDAYTVPAAESVAAFARAEGSTASTRAVAGTTTTTTYHDRHGKDVARYVELRDVGHSWPKTGYDATREMYAFLQSAAGHTGPARAIVAAGAEASAGRGSR